MNENSIVSFFVLLEGHIKIEAPKIFPCSLMSNEDRNNL